MGKLKKISFISGLYNEGNNLVEFVGNIFNGLKSRFGDDFEIILVENGSTDNTAQILQDMISSNIYENKVVFRSIREKGLGLAYKAGIEMASGEFVLLSAIDLPFGFSDVDWLLSHNCFSANSSLTFFSKRHRLSVISRPLIRRISSLVLNTILKIMFDVNIKDTQGSVFLAREDALRLIKLCRSKSLFFTAQMAIYSKHIGIRCYEAPIAFQPCIVGRKTSFSLIKDGAYTTFDILKEAFFYYFIFRGGKGDAA